MSPERLSSPDDRFYEFDLFREGWKPVWHYFPLVKRGERLTRLWTDLRGDLEHFANREIRRAEDEEQFEGEIRALVVYAHNHRKGWMDGLRIRNDHPGALSRLELWDMARRISAGLFVRDFLGEDNLDTHEASVSMRTVLGEEGEDWVAIDLEDHGKRSYTRKALPQCDSSSVSH